MFGAAARGATLATAGAPRPRRLHTPDPVTIRGTGHRLSFEWCGRTLSFPRSVATVKRAEMAREGGESAGSRITVFGRDSLTTKIKFSR